MTYEKLDGAPTIYRSLLEEVVCCSEFQQCRGSNFGLRAMCHYRRQHHLTGTCHIANTRSLYNTYSSRKGMRPQHPKSCNLLREHYELLPHGSYDHACAAISCQEGGCILTLDWVLRMASDSVGEEAPMDVEKGYF